MPRENRKSESLRAGILREQVEQGLRLSSFIYSPRNAGIGVLSFSGPAFSDGAYGYDEAQAVWSLLEGTR